MPFFAEKSQIHNIKNGFYNFNNSNNLCELFGISEQLTAREVNHRKLGDSWGAVGRKLGNRFCGHLGQLIYMRKNSETGGKKALTLNYMRKNFQTRGIVYGNAYTQKF